MVSFIAVFGLLFVTTDEIHTLAFAWDTASTRGAVVELQSENHNTARISYRVASRDYELLRQRSSDLVVGQEVAVYYLRSAPEQSALEQPSEILSSAFLQLILVAALAAAFTTWLIQVWQRQLRKH